MKVVESRLLTLRDKEMNTINTTLSVLSDQHMKPTLLESFALVALGLLQWWWLYRWTNGAPQTNKATIHVGSFVMETTPRPPNSDTENRLGGKSAKTTDRQRSLPLCACRICSLWVALRQASAPQSGEQGGNERPDLIPPWAGRSYGLESQGGPALDPGVFHLAADTSE